MSRPLPRIVLLNPFDAYAGSQRVADAIYHALNRTGYRVAVRLGFGGEGFLSALPGTHPDVRCNHINTRKLLYPLWALLLMIPIAWSTLKGRLIWANTVYAVLPAFLAAMIQPRRVIVHLHEVTFAAPFRLILRLVAWRGARIVCVSLDQAERIGLPATILPNSVTLPDDDAPSLRNRLLFVGTSQPIKGLNLFVDTCSRLRDLPFKKTAYLSDRARHDTALVEAARTAGIEVIFGEKSPKVIYRDGFLLLLCTDPKLWCETFSLVAAEAVSHLVPVGGTGTTVLPEVLERALAFDMPSRLAEEIADEIRNLHVDRNRYEALVSACAARRVFFSEGVFAKRLDDLIQQRGRVV